MDYSNNHFQRDEESQLSPTAATRLPPGDPIEGPPAPRAHFRKCDTPDLPVNNNVGEKTKFPEESMKRIDYVLMYKVHEEEANPDRKTLKDQKKRTMLREKFIEEMHWESLELQADEIEGNVYIKIHAPLKRLCQEADRCALEMPLLGMENYKDEEDGCWTKLQEKYFVTDDEVDFVSAPFHVSQMYKFEGHQDADAFFRPAVRSYLTHNILINMDIRDEKEEEEDPFAKKGLPYLRMKKVFTDSFILHDETLNDPALADDINAYKARLGSQFLNETTAGSLPNPAHMRDDTRKELNDLWAKRWFKYQPLWKIRNYFGEKIGLYFAWSGTLIMSLWIPSLFGLGVFFYGLHLSINRSNNAASSNPDNATDSLIASVQATVEESIGIIRESFDNDVTPYFALVICLWGTIFLEVWKRKNHTLAYEWDVDTFENAEPDRPEFYGTTSRQNPVIPDEFEWIYPVYKQVMKYLWSFSVLIIMVICVFICAGSVVLYRVYMTVDYCTQDLSAVECLIVSTIISSVLQAITIMILGKVYEKLAVVLTDWENHRTQTQYDDSLIIKMFAFQFANSYTSLFYIAFFRGITFSSGIFGLGSEYQDSCGSDGNCMAMLSLQVLVLMLFKPVPRFLKDVILPFLRKMWRLKIKPCLFKKCSCCCCCCKGSVSPTMDRDQVEQEICNYLVRERSKPQLGDFTLMEYTEKVIVYGFLMLFSASLPLAPLIALLVNWLDMRIDARRMLWWYRRPVALIAQDIGMWYGILQFLNMAGVVTNGFLIAFTSSWGSKFSLTEKLWIVIGFEHIVFSTKFLLAAFVPDYPANIKLSMRRHIVFAVKFLLAALIPDVPSDIQLSMKREKYQVGKILAKNKEEYSLSRAASAHHRKRRETSSEEVKPTLASQLGTLPPIATTVVIQANEITTDPDNHGNNIETTRRRKKKKRKQHAHGENISDNASGFSTTSSTCIYWVKDSLLPLSVCVDPGDKCFVPPPAVYHSPGRSRSPGHPDGATGHSGNHDDSLGFPVSGDQERHFHDEERRRTQEID